MGGGRVVGYGEGEDRYVCACVWIWIWKGIGNWNDFQWMDGEIGRGGEGEEG